MAEATFMKGWRDVLEALNLKPRPTQQRALAAVEAGADAMAEAANTPSQGRGS